MRFVSYEAFEWVECSDGVFIGDADPFLVFAYMYLLTAHPQ